jgi:hypothetical protein
MLLINYMKTNTGRNIVSIILALGLACILRIACKEANMIIIKGPPLESTENKIFSFDSKCYSYKTIATSCKNMENNKVE